MRLTKSQRNRLSNEIHEILKPTYFERVPLGAIGEACRKVGLCLLDEDGSEWSGFLCGDDSDALIGVGSPAGEFAVNAAVALNWYRMPSGRFEVIGYLTVC